MDATTMHSSPLADEQLGFELPSKNDDYAVGLINTGRKGEQNAPSTSELPAIPPVYATTFSAANINKTLHPKHVWSRLVSAATGGRRHSALSHVTTSTPAGPSCRASQPPFMRLGASLTSSGNSTRSSCVGNDGRKSEYNRLLPISAAKVLEASSSVEKEDVEWGKEEDNEEEEEVVTAVNSGAGLWASRGMLAGVAMLYGTNFGCVKLLEETIPMSLAAMLRFTVAAVPFLPFLIKTSPGVFRAGIEIGLFDAIGFWSQSKSLTTTTASKAAFICSLSVILVPAMDAVFGARDGAGSNAAKATGATDEKRQAVGGSRGDRHDEQEATNGRFAILHGPWFPALLAVAGVACLEFIGAESGPSTGDVWALVQPLCFSVVYWLTERSSRKYPGDAFGIVATHLLTVAVLAIGWCAQAGQLPVSFKSFHETVLPSSGSLTVVLALLWTGLVTTSLTAFAETLAMEKVSAAESAVIYATEPIWSTAFAAAVLGETIGWNTWLGAVLIILACTWGFVGPAIQSKLQSLVAAMGMAGTGLWATKEVKDGLIETIGTNSQT